jgi:hypothetical protein
MCGAFGATLLDMAGSAFRGSGYVQLPGKPEHAGEIWLTFNPQIYAAREGARHQGFCLRLSATWPRVREGPPEIGITLTIEQWLDLIAQMQQELRRSEELRKEFDNWASPKITFYVCQTAQFARTARQAYERMQAIGKQIPDLKEIPQSHLEAQRAITQRHIGLSEEADRDAFVAVAFAAFALESFVNGWAVRDLPARYASDFLDKLSLVAKWVIIPRLAANIEIEREGQLFEKLRMLVKDRNELAHPKTKKVELGSLQELAKKFRDPMQAADDAIAALDEAAEFVRDQVGPSAAGLLLGEIPESKGGKPIGDW